MSYTKDDACYDLGILFQRSSFFLDNFDPLTMKKEFCSIISQIDSLPSNTQVGNVVGTPANYWQTAGGTYISNNGTCRIETTLWAYKLGSPTTVSLVGNFFANEIMEDASGNSTSFLFRADWTGHEVAGASGYFFKVYFAGSYPFPFTTPGVVFINNKYYDNGNSLNLIDATGLTYTDSPPYP